MRSPAPPSRPARAAPGGLRPATFVVEGDDAASEIAGLAKDVVAKYKTVKHPFYAG